MQQRKSDVLRTCLLTHVISKSGAWLARFLYHVGMQITCMSSAALKLLFARASARFRDQDLASFGLTASSVTFEPLFSRSELSATLDGALASLA